MAYIPLLIAEAYSIGFALVALHSSYLWGQMQAWKKSGISDIIDSHVDMKPWLIRRIVFWPYLLFFKTNPINIFSELLFSRYGDKGYRYFGSKGLRNFSNDLFRGVRRYKNYQVKTSLIHIDQEIASKRNKDFLCIQTKPKYAKVIIAKYKKNYLFKVCFCSVNDSDVLASRFELDDCQRLTKEQVISSLNELNPAVTKELLE